MSDQLPTGPETVPAPPPAKHGWLNFVIDFGPLLVFFLAYKFSSGGEGAGAATTPALKGPVAVRVALVAATSADLRVATAAPATTRAPTAAVARTNRFMCRLLVGFHTGGCLNSEPSGAGPG